MKPTELQVGVEHFYVCVVFVCLNVWREARLSILSCDWIHVDCLKYDCQTHTSYLQLTLVG
jgi:hypothetical protein